MRKLKLLTVLMVAGMAAFALTACGNGKEESTEGNKSSITSEKETSTADSKKEEQTTVTGDKKEEQAAGGVKITELAKQMAEKRTDIVFVEMTEAYIEGVMSFDVSKVSEYSVYVDASGTSVDEFGIFKAQEGCGDDVQKMLQSYLEMRLDTWMDEYMPEEKPKVEKAEIKKNGDYYIYAILSEDEKEQAFQNFDSATAK